MESNPGGHLGDRNALDRHEAERLPGVGRDAQAHPHLGRFQQFEIESFLQLLHQVFAGLQRQHPILGIGVAGGGKESAAVVLEIPPGVVSHRLEPSAEAARRVVGEGAKLVGEFHEDVLGEILGVGVL